MKTLAFKLREADGEDIWLTCIACERPIYNEGKHVGKPVEFTFVIRGNGCTRGVGLHENCWRRNGGTESDSE